MFGKSFNSSKCKTVVRLATSRIKLLRNKREMQVNQMRRDVAMLLESGQDATARIRVEHVIREQNVMEANEIIELFCELIVVRLPIIAKQRACPADLKEGVSSLIFAAPRCSDIPELLQLRKIFEKKYGKDFVTSATELRPDCGVNRTLIEKLSVRTPSGEVKFKLMKDIAKEYQVKWDTKDSELELLKPPEELLEGPRTFVRATSLPLTTRISKTDDQDGSRNRSSKDRDSNYMQFKNIASAAQAAAESAEKAIAAAQAAAFLAHNNSQISPTDKVDGVGGSVSSSKPSGNTSHFVSSDSFRVDNSGENYQPNVRGQLFESQSFNGFHPTNNSEVHHANTSHFVSSDGFRVDNSGKIYQPNVRGQLFESQSFNGFHSTNNSEVHHASSGDKDSFRSHNSNGTRAHSDIKFDDSDDGLDSEYDEEIYMESPNGYMQPPPKRPPPSVPEARSANTSGSHKQNSASRIHPKLPDYDALSARFEALKHQRSCSQK